MTCQYNDCGWCYAPAHLTSNDKNGQCQRPTECPTGQTSHSPQNSDTADDNG